MAVDAGAAQGRPQGREGRRAQARPRTPLTGFLLAVLLPALTAGAVPPKAPKARAYRAPLESAGRDGAIAVDTMQCHLRAGEGGAIGGASQAASMADACWSAAGQCLVLLAQLEDMIAAEGDKVSPHAYAVADKVLGAAAKTYGSLAKLDAALLASSRAPAGSYSCFGRAAASPAERAPASAREQALSIIRRALKSSRVVPGVSPGDPLPLAAHGARWAGKFDDAAVFLARELKSNAASTDPLILGETVKTLGERVRDADTAARLMALFRERESKRRELSEPLKLRILSSLRMTLSQLHRMRRGEDGGSAWLAKDLEAGKSYFSFACGLLADEGCAGEDGSDAGEGKPVCAAARELLIFTPKPRDAACPAPRRK